MSKTPTPSADARTPRTNRPARPRGAAPRARRAPIAIALPFALVFALAFAPTPALAQVDDVVIGNKLNEFNDRLDRVVDDAARAGDYLVEKNARMVHLLVDNLSAELDAQRNDTLDRLSAENQRVLATADRLVQEVSNASGRLLDLEDFLALDLAEILGQLPIALGRTKLHSLRRIDGYSQIHQDEGVYTFRVIGNTFGPGYVCDVRVRGVPVRLLDMRTSQARTLEFDVPVEVLNPEFRDDEVARVDLELVCRKTDDAPDAPPAFSTKAKILLLPRAPLSYRLIEHRVEKTWSAETYWSAEGRDRIARRGEVTVSTRIPDGCLMLKDTVTITPTPDQIAAENLRVQRFQQNGRVFAWADDLRFTDEDRVVSRTLRFFGAERRPAQPVSIKVQYRKPVERVVDAPVTFEAGPSRDRLPFGTSFARLAPGSKSFTLETQWFNGRKAILTPTRSAAPGIKVDRESVSGFSRLVVHVSWPDAGVPRGGKP